jgi:hypothetical protein
MAGAALIEPPYVLRGAREIRPAREAFEEPGAFVFEPPILRALCDLRTWRRT